MIHSTIVPEVVNDGIRSGKNDTIACSLEDIDKLLENTLAISFNLEHTLFGDSGFENPRQGMQPDPSMSHRLYRYASEIDILRESLLRIQRTLEG